MTTENKEIARYVGAKIQEYFDSKNIKQVEVANRLGISQAAVSCRLRGLKPFGKNAATVWAKEFGFSYGWLLSGEGDMFGSSSQTITASGDNSVATGNNSPVTINASSSIYEKMIENLTKENINLKMRLLRLAEIIDKNGIPCDDDACKL